jgi:hypothetical protein
MPQTRPRLLLYAMRWAAAALLAVLAALALMLTL